MDAEPQAKPDSLEDLASAVVEYAQANDPDDPPPIAELEAALKRRLDLLGGPDVDADRIIRSGLALTRLGTFARKVGALRVEATAGDEAIDVEPERMRDAIARDLAFAIHDAGDYGELEVLERAKAIRDLTEAYVRLGGELRLMAPADRPLPPIRETEDVIASIWRRLNADHLPTATIDAVVAVVRSELEAPATELREASA